MVVGLSILAFFALAGYAFLLRYVYVGWKRTPEWFIPEAYAPSTSISIVVAARNEEKYVKRCVDAILGQDYPSHLLEVVFIDDQSTDDTPAILDSIKDPRFRWVSTTSKGGKKAAISIGVKQAKGKVILVTDADSIPGENWVKSYVSFYEQNEKRIIAGPIQYIADDSVLKRFQYLDSIGNMAVTASGIHHQSFYLANGANLLYEKSLFEELEGYQNDQRASGDDVMLIQKAALHNPNDIAFLKCKETIVETEAEGSWQELISQRKRWATKSSGYVERGILFVQAYVFAFAAMIPGYLVFSIFFGKQFFLLGLGLLGIKWILDYFYLKSINVFFRDKSPMRSFVPTSVIFICYIFAAAYFALFPSSYDWKGRNVS